MAEFVLRDPKIWLGQYDFSGDHREMALEYSADEVEETSFGDATHIRASGSLRIAAFSAAGFWEAGTGMVDTIYQSKIAVADEVLTVAADGGDDGEASYSMLALFGEYNHGGQIGEVLPFTVRAGCSGNRLVRGTIMHNATRTVSGNGTGRQLGAVGATQKLYAALHVTAASGTSPTLDAIVQSDDNSGFTSPTTRITFAQKTAAGSEWATPVSGAITDDWWRINYTIAGTGPSFTFIAVVAIL